MIGKALLAFMGLVPVPRTLDSRLGVAREKAQRAMSIHRVAAAKAQSAVLDIIEQQHLDPIAPQMRAHNDKVRGMLAGLMKSMEPDQ